MLVYRLRGMVGRELGAELVKATIGHATPGSPVFFHFSAWSGWGFWRNHWHFRMPTRYGDKALDIIVSGTVGGDYNGNLLKAS